MASLRRLRTRGLPFQPVVDGEVLPGHVEPVRHLAYLPDVARLEWAVNAAYHAADAPKLDVRLPGLEDHSPRRALFTRGDAVDGWETLGNPQDVYRLHDVNDLLVEGGSEGFLGGDGRGDVGGLGGDDLVAHAPPRLPVAVGVGGQRARRHGCSTCVGVGSGEGERARAECEPARLAVAPARLGKRICPGLEFLARLPGPGGSHGH